RSCCWSCSTVKRSQRKKCTSTSRRTLPSGSYPNSSWWSMKSRPPRLARSIRRLFVANTKICTLLAGRSLRPACVGARGWVSTETWIGKPGYHEPCWDVSESSWQTRIGITKYAPEEIFSSRIDTVPGQVELDAELIG